VRKRAPNLSLVHPRPRKLSLIDLYRCDARPRRLFFFLYEWHQVNQSARFDIETCREREIFTRDGKPNPARPWARPGSHGRFGLLKREGSDITSGRMALGMRPRHRLTLDLRKMTTTWSEHRRSIPSWSGISATASQPVLGHELRIPPLHTTSIQTPTRVQRKTQPVNQTSQSLSYQGRIAGTRATKS